MQIDWLTVGAQVANFLILVALLQRFLYGPIVRAVDRREAEIAERLRTATERESAAQAEAAAYRERRHELEAERGRRLADARAEAEGLRARLAEEARGEVDATRRRWEGELEGEREAFLRDVRRQAAEQFDALPPEEVGRAEAIVRQALREALPELCEAIERGAPLQEPDLARIVRALRAALEG